MSTLSSALASLGYETDSNGNPIIENPLAPARPNSSSTSLPNTDTLPNAIASLTGVAQGTATSGAKSVTTGMFGSLETWLASSTANIVAVLIGLVLVAGAVWGFDTVHDTVISTAKGAAALAA
jgi:hypothetical protein